MPAAENIEEIGPLVSDEDDDRVAGCADTFYDPKRGGHRFIALILMCIIGFGSYFCYDNPGALQDSFIDDLSLTTTQFVNLYSWYSWPNTILCFVGGFLLDRYCRRLANTSSPAFNGPIGNHLAHDDQSRTTNPGHKYRWPGCQQ